MVASRQVEIPFYRGIDRQRGRGFGALAQVIGRTAIPFLRKLSSQLQKALVLTCWKMPCQSLQMLLVVEKISRQLERVWEDKFWGVKWVVVAWKGVQAKSFQRKLKNNPVGGEETFSTNISHHSCRVIFNTKLLLQFLEILEGKSQ